MNKKLLGFFIIGLLAAGCAKSEQATVKQSTVPGPSGLAVPTLNASSTDTQTVDQQRIANIEAGVFNRPTDAEIKKMLTGLQYQVTQEQGTEEPFHNEYWNNEKPGLYVDIVSGAPLFSSTDKYDSGTGWPSFTKPISQDFIELRSDNSLLEQRTEVVGAISKSHLGHVFDDGPAPLGKRYCMNSAALKFIPAASLKDQGYGKYSYLFK